MELAGPPPCCMIPAEFVQACKHREGVQGDLCPAMIRPPFALLYLSHFVQGTNTNTTGPACPELDGSYRSVWNIMGSCAVTLLVCVWHAVHLDVPELGEELVLTLGKHVLFIIGGFLAPEFLIGIATKQWIRAHRSVIEFGEKGYEWSMTHSYFADTGGFVYRNKEGDLKVINALEFLELCETGKIVNPFITENDINDKSKSDAVSKAIFTIQLLWFMLQIVVRHFIGLTVTLAELDTLCMSLPAVFYLLLWWNKPLNAGSPHVFDEAQEDKVYSPEDLSNAWKSQPCFLHELKISIVRTLRRLNSVSEPDKARLFHYIRVIVYIMIPMSFRLRDGRKPLLDGDKENLLLESAKRGCFLRRLVQCTCNLSSATFKKMIKKIDPDKGSVISFFVAWCVLGALHLTAWNYEFPTERQASMWRGASLALIASVFVPFVAWLFDLEDGSTLAIVIAMYAIVTRAILVVVILQSLRALPCSAHQTIPWVQYIPHI